MYDVIIIGGGPAGISASIYAVSRGLKTLILEKSRIGGTIRPVSTVTHYSGVLPTETGISFSERLQQQAKSAGVELRFEEVVSANLEGNNKTIKTNQESYQTKTVIIATGTTPRKLGIPGEEQFASYWLSDDHSIYQNQEVFIVGGSDGALKEALYLSKIAAKVTIIHFEEKLGAIPEFTLQAEKKENIEIKLLSRLTAIEGDYEIERIEITHVDDANKEYLTVPHCKVIIYAGSLPNSSLFSNLSQENGYLTTNTMCETAIDGVYAIGDVCKKQVRQISTAVADGTLAGISAGLYIKSST